MEQELQKQQELDGNHPLVKAFVDSKKVKEPAVTPGQRYDSVTDFLNNNTGPLTYGGGKDSVLGLFLDKNETVPTN